jgi:hypothetical protein
MFLCSEVWRLALSYFRSTSSRIVLASLTLCLTVPVTPYSQLLIRQLGQPGGRKDGRAYGQCVEMYLSTFTGWWSGG